MIPMIYEIHHIYMKILINYNKWIESLKSCKLKEDRNMRVFLFSIHQFVNIIKRCVSVGHSLPISSRGRRWFAMLQVIIYLRIIANGGCYVSNRKKNPVQATEFSDFASKNKK